MVQVVSVLHQQGAGWDSARLASHLERLARKEALEGWWQLAQDMYTRLGMHEHHCQLLLTRVRLQSPASHALTGFPGSSRIVISCRHTSYFGGQVLCLSFSSSAKWAPTVDISCTQGVCPDRASATDALAKVEAVCAYLTQEPG